jgi:hypothetical protein
VLRDVRPSDVLPQAAVYAVLAAVRSGTTGALILFASHGALASEYALALSLVPD